MEMMDILLAKSMAAGESSAKAEEIVNNHFVAGTNIVISDNPDGTQTISASGEVSSEDTVAREEIANHIADTNNPHSVTKSQLGLENVDNVKQVAGLGSGTTQNNLVKWGADGYTVADSGVAVETSISDSDAKVPTSKAIYTALGNKQDTIADLATIEAGAAAGATAVQPGDIGTAAAKNVDYFATAAQGGKADSAIQGVKVNNSAITPDSNKTVDITIDKTTVGLGNVDNNQQVRALATTPTENNLVTWGANGYTVKNSGKAISTTVASTSTDNDIPTAKAVYTEVNKKQNKLTFDDAPTSGSSNPVKSSGIYTALAGKEATISDLSEIRTGAGKGATAIQSVKVNGTALTPDANSAVDVTAVTGVKGNSESTYRTGEVNITKSNIGLGNVDNNKQVRALSTTPTENHITTWGANAYTVKDSGKSIVTTISSSSTDDGVPTAKAAYTELAKKQDTLTFDGTYDASTNKAATKSTVTNAINALDVTGASGISASKTISAWSETNGKVSISTQDIAITGTQTVLTGYQKSTTAGQAVAATDTVNGAIGKIEKRVSDNESNISKDEATLVELVDGGAKNILDVNTSFTTGTSKGVTYTNNGDQTYTITTGSSGSTANDSFAQLYDVNADNLFGVKKGEKVVISSTSNSVACAIVPKYSGGYGTTIRGYKDSPIEYIIPSNFTGFLLRIGVTTSGTVVDENVGFMICTKAAWDISHAYVPYRKDLAELTVDTDEDRASLVELVDDGAKNIIEVGNAICTRYGVTAVLSSDGSIVLSGKAEGATGNFLIANDIKTGSQSASYASLIPIKSGIYKSGIYTASGLSDDRVILQVLNYNSSSDVDTFESDVFTTTKQYIDFRLMLKRTADFTTPLTVYPMCCTKAAWDISHAYQPYALPNSDLTALSAEDRASLVELVDGEAKNLMQVSATSTTTAGIVYTVSNGIITLESGTAANNPSLIGVASTITIPKGNYVLSGCPSGGGDSSYRLDMRIQGTSTVLAIDSGESAEVTLTSDTVCSFYIRLIGGYQVSTPLVFKPMLCTKAAWDISHEYQPYRPSYQELTKENRRKVYANTEDSTSYTFSDLYGLNESRFKYALVCGGGTANNPALAMAWFVFIDNSGVVTIRKIIGDSPRTLTGSVSGTTLTLTSDSVVYGGLRLIWLS